MKNFFMLHLVLFLAIFAENTFGLQPVSNQGRTNFQTIISTKEALEDLDFFFSTMESVHPQLLANVSPDDYLDMKHEIRKWVDENSGSISLSEFIRTLTKSAAFFKDGHTGVHAILTLFDESDTSRCILPFFLEYRLGKVVIRKTAKELKELSGQRLVKINNVELTDFILAIGKKRERNLNSFSHFQRMSWYLASLDIKIPNIVITTQNSSGKLENHQVDLITFKDYDKLFTEPNLAMQPSHFSFYNNNRVCYYRYNGFRDSKYERQMIDSLFTLIEEYQIKNLIIDLRYNGGGSSDMIDYLLRYLTSKPYRMFSKYDTKISEQLIYQQKNYEYYKELAGLVITHPVEMTKPKNINNRFRGRLFVLTSPITFSSAAGFAAIIKDNELGTLIGEETGGLRETFGNVVPFFTPNYKIRFGVSNRKFYTAIPKPGDDEHGTVPDIIITEKILKEHQNQDDPVLSFTLELIEKE